MLPYEPAIPTDCDPCAPALPATPGVCDPATGDAATCGDADFLETHAEDADHVAEQVRRVLADHGVTAPETHIADFAGMMASRMRAHAKWLRCLARDEGLGPMDIFAFIADARDAGDLDEALWRTFLAIHFGSTSASSASSESAGRFLCGFGGAPALTWKWVSGDPAAVSAWLHAHAAELSTLHFGNHRRRRSQKPDAIEKVLLSFVDWVRSRGGSPAAAFALPAGSTPPQGFWTLYDAFHVHEFGRLGNFDLLCLLGDMQLLPITPDSCHLAGSTGPKQGAEKLCGPLNVHELTRIGDDLAQRLEVSPSLIENALCMWRK